MKPVSRRLVCQLGMSTALLPMLSPALGQGLSAQRPVRIVVPTPAGGASDAAARLLAQAISPALGQQVVVENKPGANGVLALQAVLGAPPDGHTLLWTLSSMAGIPVLVKGAPVKALSELTPVSQLVQVQYGFFTHPSVPANSMAELTTQLRAQPDKLNYATGTLGEYMAAAHYLKVSGVRALRVPYKGGAQLMPDLVSGQVQFNVGPLYAGLPHVRAGKLKLLAVFPQRSNATPQTPTMAEAGIAPGNIPTWNGLMAPPGTPREIVNRLAAELASALNQPAVRQAVESQGLQAAANPSPQAMGEAVEQAGRAWRDFVRDYDIPPE